MIDAKKLPSTTTGSCAALSVATEAWTVVLGPFGMLKSTLVGTVHSLAKPLSACLCLHVYLSRSLGLQVQACLVSSFLCQEVGHIPSFVEGVGPSDLAGVPEFKANDDAC